MALTSGAQLGPYEILAPIGAGGMGEVYRARDSKLDRQVAIKVLPEALAEDPERLIRFEREAKVLASLNHPNIAQIYGLEGNALVMELVAGSTLSVPQPLETSLNYAKQIAEALEAAHEKGITHRDLKPANIMITPEGVIKVLDFGLASVPSHKSEGDPRDSPTLTLGTGTGVILGTAAYMSPEQAAGQVVDKRSDIWSFGVVLWEMIAGRRLFEGETISHVLAEVMRAAVDFSQLKAPAPVVDLLRRCLDRDRKTRLRDIGEARVAITKILADPMSGAETAAKAAGPRQNLVWKLAAVLAILVAAIDWYLATRPQELKPLVRLDVDLGPDVSLPSQGGADAVLSPDGTRLAYVSQSRVFTRRLDQPKGAAPAPRARPAHSFRRTAAGWPSSPEER